MGLIPFEYLTFAGKNLGDFGVWISGSGTFNAPARDVSFQTVPGRNGDLLFDNGRFENVSVTYPAFISRRFQPRIDDLRAFLAGQIGYQILRDTYHPDEFRQAAFVTACYYFICFGNGYISVCSDCKHNFIHRRLILPAVRERQKDSV